MDESNFRLPLHPPTAEASGQQARAYPKAVPDYRAKMVRNWTLVKRASFNASKRYERKQSASTLAFAIAGSVGFIIPFFTALFEPNLVKHTRQVWDFIAYVTGGLSLCIGLVEQAKSYPDLARKFHTMGLQVNSALRRLHRLHPADDKQVQALIEDYERALATSELNHDDIDRNIALAEETLERARRDLMAAQDVSHAPQVVAATAAAMKAASKELAKVKRLEMVQIYWIYWFIWIGPAVAGLMIWLWIPEAGQTGH